MILLQSLFSYLSSPRKQPSRSLAPPPRLFLLRRLSGTSRWAHIADLNKDSDDYFLCRMSKVVRRRLIIALSRTACLQFRQERQEVDTGRYAILHASPSGTQLVISRFLGLSDNPLTSLMTGWSVGNNLLASWLLSFQPRRLPPIRRCAAVCKTRHWAGLHEEAAGVQHDENGKIRSFLSKIRSRGVRRACEWMGRLHLHCMVSEDTQTEDSVSSDHHHPEHVWFWHPLSLKFYDEHHEHLYSTLLAESLVRSERFVHLLGAVPGIVITVSFWATITWTAMMMELGWSFLLAPFFFFLSAFQPRVYRAWRLPIVVFIRWGHIVTMNAMVVVEGLPPATSGGVILRLVAKSPIANMVFCALNLSMPFRHHIFISSIQLLISLVWVQEFCTMCGDPSLAFSKVFDRIAQIIDNCTVTVFFFNDLAIKDRSTVSCEVVAMFFIVSFGFIVPAALVYCLEISSRSRFLLERVPELYTPAVVKFKTDGCKVAIWFALGGLQFVWLCLTLFFL
ncbi:hypothetical protein BSKO_11479 [Bryopsis sp. KO-2023]|nr:hypothetical protein BSKO_11479 [Bryopsis sp. KO-2023]